MRGRIWARRPHSLNTVEVENRQLGGGRREARRLPDGLRRDATATFRGIRRTDTADFKCVSHGILLVVAIRVKGRQPARLRFPRWWADCRAVPPGGIR